MAKTQAGDQKIAIDSMPEGFDRDEAIRKRMLVDARNERRRTRYATDPEYRSTARNLSRRTYENAEGVDLNESVDRVAAKVRRIARFGAYRPVYVERLPIGAHVCLTEVEMAMVIGRHHQVFQRMITDGRLPEPIYSIRSNRTKVYVYLIQEAEALARAYLAHLQVSLHYYAFHEETKRAIFAAVFEARKKLETNKWIMQTEGV